MDQRNHLLNETFCVLRYCVRVHDVRGVHWYCKFKGQCKQWMCCTNELSGATEQGKLQVPTNMNWTLYVLASWISSSSSTIIGMPVLLCWVKSNVITHFTICDVNEQWSDVKRKELIHLPVYIIYFVHEMIFLTDCFKTVSLTGPKTTLNHFLTAWCGQLYMSKIDRKGTGPSALSGLRII